MVTFTAVGGSSRALRLISKGAWSSVSGRAHKLYGAFATLLASNTEVSAQGLHESEQEALSFPMWRVASRTGGFTSQT